MTETQERFLRTVLSRVPLDSVVELHLFPPIRRGTLETGVAVIATVLPPAPVAMLMEEEISADTPAEMSSAEDGDDGDSAVLDSDAACANDEGAVLDSDAAEIEMTDDAIDEPRTASAVQSEPAVDDDSPYLDEPEAAAASAAHDADAANEADMTEAADDVDDAVDTVAPLAIPSPRMRILTAAYRHTIKGIDRGKWSVDVQEEADAPLDAVEAVLRGVRHRSTEPADPEQVSHEALTALVAPPLVAPVAA